jgi:hypothetical protein
MASRHTALPEGSQITRSLGEDGESDFVAELRGNGTLKLRMEPTGRKLVRNEVLPEMELDLHELWRNRKTAPESDNWLDELIAAIPIADFSGPPDRVGYQAKVWILNYLKQKNEKATD